MRKVGFVAAAGMALALVFGVVPAQLAGAATVSTHTHESITPNPSRFGELVYLTATVGPTNGGGAVTFSFGGDPIPGCGPLALGSGLHAAANQAVCSTTLLPTGSDQVTAAYSGDLRYKPSSVTVAHLVIPDKTTTHAQPALLKLLLGVKLFQLSARVTNDSLGGIPVVGVPVNMTSGGTFICQGTTNAQGVATCNGLGSLLPIILRFGYLARFPGNIDYFGSYARAGLIG